ncbi:MAG TPA: c-type cytochrome [Polyangiaceae bacterium]|nr:c-type cytochrome [Polyangiaceae bacterium]
MGWIKKALLGVGGLLGVAGLAVGGFVYSKVSAYNASLDKVYDVPLPNIERTTDPVLLARGEHLAHTIMPCADSGCHGNDLGGGKTENMGPIGTLAAPNITAGGLGAAYSDAELARLMTHGVKKDGRGVRFMPSHESNWLSDQDIAATISYVRTLPPQSKPSPSMGIGVLGKVLDQMGMIPIDVARRIDHTNIAKGPPPTPDAAYGKYLGRLCTGCHGEKLSGGPIPGAPPEMPIPLNLTPDATGLAGYSLDDFKQVMRTGKRKKDGRQLAPMMPVESFGKFDDVEMQALYSYLMSLPATPFGQR